MTSRARWLILALSVIGLGVSFAASYVHYHVILDPTYHSMCDISSTLSCTQVYASRYGTVMGVPVAVGGVAWFALVAIIGFFAETGEPGNRGTGDLPGSGRSTTTAAGGYIFALATIGLAVVLYLAYASFFILRTGCVLCMATYVCVIGIFIVSGLTTNVSMLKLPLRFSRDLRAIVTTPVLLVVGVLYLAGAASAVAFFPREGQVPQAAPAPTADQQAQFAQIWAQQKHVDLGIPMNGAKVLLVKFNDWLCPGCKAYAQAYQPVLDKFAKESPGAVRLVLKDWPWNSTCNFNVTQTINGHQGSCAAAAAVRIAGDHGKADEMGRWLFDNQERIVQLGMSGGDAPGAVRDEAQTLLGITDFDAQYRTKVLDIQRDASDGKALGLVSTPWFFLNGVLITDAQQGQCLPPAYVEMAIRLELAKAGGAK